MLERALNLLYVPRTPIAHQVVVAQSLARLVLIPRTMEHFGRIIWLLQMWQIASLIILENMEEMSHAKEIDTTLSFGAGIEEQATMLEDVGRHHKDFQQMVWQDNWYLLLVQLENTQQEEAIVRIAP